MPRQLFLHCGPPKTGSSAIQAALRDTPPEGLCYPQTGQWPDGAHHKLVFSMQGQRARGAIDIPGWDDLKPALCAELDHAIAAGQDVVISAESLSPDLAQQFLDQVLPLLTQGFDAVTAVVVLRHPLERSASAYNQQIKDAVTDETRMPNIYLREAGPQFALTKEIQRWQDTPMQVRFLSYHPASDLVDRFLDLTGHSAPAQETPAKRKNPSMNGYAIAALLCGRRAGFDADQRTALFAALREDKSNRLWGGPSFPFSPKAVRWYLDEIVAPDLDEVRRLTGIQIPPVNAAGLKRFSLDEAQCAAIRSHFDGVQMTPQQQTRMDRVLEVFG